LGLFCWRRTRNGSFLNPWSDPLGKGFQIIQSYIAVGTGGIDGVGFMEGRQKLFYLPEPHTDFIFAVICEELGLLGALAVIVLFGVILWRGLRAAAACSNDFGRLLAIGLTVLVVGQALVNMSVVLGLLPTKGIPLPLVSYGGSSLLMNLLALGILLNISQHAT
jgi:cell division protein FtsW